MLSRWSANSWSCITKMEDCLQTRTSSYRKRQRYNMNINNDLSGALLVRFARGLGRID